ncbi:Transcriptional regulator, TetR family (plasmid) [Cupriavidus necator]|uniref:TetR/AcrR family transcriptional regulator n=1 Tax=Cupriavidus necator TaxID=106590 RepID=UPI003F73F8CB
MASAQDNLFDATPRGASTGPDPVPAGTRAPAAKRGRPKKMGADSVPVIKSAALELFATKGFGNTTLEEVGAKVGFTKGGVYYYFRSKEQLLLDILGDIEARSIARTARMVAGSHASPLDKLVFFTKLQAAWAAQNPADLAILMLTSLETARETGPVAQKVRAIYAQMEEVLTRVVEEAKSAGQIRVEETTRNIVLSLLALHDGNILLWYRSGCDPTTGRMLAALSERIVLDRLRATRSD